MSIIECKCSSCGGIMKVDNENDKAICPYCGNTIVIAKPVTVNNGNYIRQQVNNNKYEQHFEPKMKATVDLTDVAFYGLLAFVMLGAFIMAILEQFF